MYICICKGITDKEVREQTLQYNGNVKQVLKALGAGSDCGTCIKDAVAEIKKEFAMSSTDSSSVNSNSDGTI